MAFQMDYTDQLTATPHPESYWEIGEFTVFALHDEVDLGMTVVRFDGWHDVTSHVNQYDPFGSKTYTLPPAVINYELTIGQGFAGMYAYAKSVPESETGHSFFENAITVNNA